MLYEQNTYSMSDFIDNNEGVKVGDKVAFHTGYGSGNRSKGIGEIAKVNKKSVQIRVIESAESPAMVSFEKGKILKGVPIALFDLASFDRWNIWNSFEIITTAPTVEK